MKTNIIKKQDCVEYMKTLPDESVDLLCTDCPYKIIAGGVRIIEAGDEVKGVLNKRDYSKTDPKGVLSRGRIVVSDGTDCSNKWLKKDPLNTPSAVKGGKMFDHNEIEFSEWLPDAYRVLKKGTHAYIMINARNLKDLQVECEKVGFEFQNLLVWHKTNTQTPNKYYMQNTEFILMLSKRPARNINNMGSKTVISIPNPKNKQHPTEKPVNLMKFLIENSTKENDIVLDPFMGSGSTAVAAKELNRKYIGTEIDGKYFKVYTKRLKQTTVQNNLF